MKRSAEYSVYLLRKQHQKLSRYFYKNAESIHVLARWQQFQPHLWPQRPKNRHHPSEICKPNYAGNRFSDSNVFWREQIIQTILLWRESFSQNSSYYQQLQCFSPSKFLWSCFFFLELANLWPYRLSVRYYNIIGR